MQADNIEGKNFDANTAYCSQLRAQSTAMVQFDPRTTSAPTSLTRSAFVSQTQRDQSARQHLVDCESRSAYNLRTKVES